MAASKTESLEPKIADRLLDLLGDSDTFRELFAKDPGHALELIGHRPSGGTVHKAAASEARPAIAGCLSVRALASKEAINQARDELRTMLLGGLGQISPLLDATRRGS